MNAASVLVIIKGKHRFVFLYDENNLPPLFTVLANYAMDPELDFNWYDAFVLRQRAIDFRNNREPTEET